MIIGIKAVVPNLWVATPKGIVVFSGVATVVWMPLHISDREDFQHFFILKQRHETDCMLRMK